VGAQDGTLAAEGRVVSRPRRYPSLESWLLERLAERPSTSRTLAVRYFGSRHVAGARVQAVRRALRDLEAQGRVRRVGGVGQGRPSTWCALADAAVS
jgi:hypothetical protein